jgi:putative copper resistance protein D
MEEALIGVRFVQFAAAMALFGIGAFRLYAFAGTPGPPDTPARSDFDRLLARATMLGAVVALLTAVAMIPLIAAEMADSAAAALDPATLGTVLFRTEFGDAWVWHIGFAVALLVLSAMPPRRRQIAATTLAALLVLTSLGWVGHAAEGEGAARAGHEVNQMVHLAAGGIWLGGLAPLGLLLGRAVGRDGAFYAPLARAALPHFSHMGYVAVALVALTGTVNSLFLVGSCHALVATPYGRLLMLKVALFAAMVTLALVNRFRFLPRLGDTASATMPLRALFRSVIAEQALSLAILGVVSVLGTWPPAIHAMMDMKM